MPAWLVAEEVMADYAAEEAAAATAETVAADAAAAEAGSAAATTAGTAATAAELGGLGQIGGTAGSQLGAAAEGATAIGGEGAGSAGIQQAMEGAMQKAPLEFTGALPEGYAPGQVEALTNAAGPGTQVAGPTTLSQGITSAPQTASPYSLTGPGPTVSNPAYSLPSPGTSEGLRAGASEGIKMGANAGQTYMTPEPSAWETGWNNFSKMVTDNPKTSMAAAYVGAQQMGLLNPNSVQMQNQPYNGPLSKYRLANDFQAGANRPNTNQYQATYPSYAGGGIMDAQNFPQAEIPHPGGYSNAWQSPMAREPFAGSADTPVDGMTGEMQQMASGGIASYAKGDLTSTLDYYRQMVDGQHMSAPSGKSDPGAHYAGDAYYDMDPDTRYQDALTASQIRNAKVAKRANMQMPDMKRPTPMGALNLRPPGAQAQQAQSSLDPESAAHGGIMGVHSNLGGYAAGGNPRLLKGPGDGMSDNIPATIAGKQPARLADGEFVVPADVVSHLGNGSTDAGAKKLHEMMTNVRKARTGNPKQGKQINPNKFTPK